MKMRKLGTKVQKLAMKRTKTYTSTNYLIIKGTNNYKRNKNHLCLN